ncbi:hypothetical protein C8T65DRAFT_746297 [Cerioporus squamosus]|nr:hypothetical protein C8T65DRAFT_746297 [Cerioporus squamosus]
MPPPRVLLNLSDVARVCFVATSLQPPPQDRERARRPCARGGKDLVWMCYGLTEDETVGKLVEVRLAFVSCEFHNTYVDEEHQLGAENHLRLLDKLINLEPPLPLQYLDRCSLLRASIIVAEEDAIRAETTESLASTPGLKIGIQCPSAAPAVNARAGPMGSGRTATDPIVVADSEPEPRVASSKRKRKHAIRREASGEAVDGSNERGLLARVSDGSQSANDRSAHATKRQRAGPTDDQSARTQ